MGQWGLEVCGGDSKESSRVWSDCSCFECISRHDGLLFQEKDSSKYYGQVFSALAVVTDNCYKIVLIWQLNNRVYLNFSSLYGL
jgi:hypothetical protein